MNHYGHSSGIELIMGPMFSGKTEELIRLIKRARIARQKVQLFKPVLDTRYDRENIFSHEGEVLTAKAVQDAAEIIHILGTPECDGVRVVGIDEVQFFASNIVDVVLRLANRGYRVICAGLDQDFMGRPFGCVGDIAAISDKAIKLAAVCTICGLPATKTYRKNIDVSDQFLLGGTNLYEARCRAHFDLNNSGLDEKRQNRVLAKEKSNQEQETVLPQ